MIFIKGYIYKITNNINGKIYIGFTSRTVDIRFTEHKKCSRYLNKKYKDDKSKIVYLYRAMNKYGEENFSVEQIYEIQDHEDESLVEKNFISRYNAQNPNIGYNISDGGDAPPKSYGESNYMAKLSDEEVEEVVEYLKESSLSLSSIAEKFNVHEGTIYRINIGETRYNEKEIYPLRVENPLDKRARLVIEDLLYTDLLIKDIAEKYGMCYQNVSDINNGKTFKHLTKGKNFPLKNTKGKLRCSTETQKNILQDIIQGASISEISRRYDVNRSTIYAIKKRNEL